MLHYWPHPTELMHHDNQPCPALVCHVHGDGKVNVAVFASVGGSRGKVNVTIVAQGDMIPYGEGFLTWPGHIPGADTVAADDEHPSDTQNTAVQS